MRSVMGSIDFSPGDMCVTGMDDYRVQGRGGRAPERALYPTMPEILAVVQFETIPNFPDLVVSGGYTV